MTEVFDEQIALAFKRMLVNQSAEGNIPVPTMVAVKFDPDWLHPVSEEDGKRYPSRLMRALSIAAECESLIPGEKTRLQRLLTEAENKALLHVAHRTEIPEEIEAEIEFRKYQMWYVEKYLQRAAALARERIEYLSEITTQDIANKELERCRTDKKHWFRMYGWGYDPRARTPLSIVPFELFPRQAELVDWLDDLVFERRTSGVIEKSRDEGATELIVRWGVHNWRFRDGFSMLLSSRTEDEVDKKSKQGTLFERARFQLRLLPPWMLPEGFDIKTGLTPDQLIANPSNSNQLLGQAPVENMGRGDRVTCAVFDEHAFWRFDGRKQHTSMSQTTDSIISPSSVNGRINMFADLAHDGITPKFEMDWRDHPFKTQAWHRALKYGFAGPKMSATAIAQEVDRDYDASQAGQVWPVRNETHAFISISEFLRPFKERGLEKQFMAPDGTFKIPNDWRVVRTHDFGKSEGHDWGYLLGAQPREAYPLHDTHFIFVARNLEPTGLTVEQGVAQWREFERKLHLRDATGKWLHAPHASWHSHEQKDLRRVLLSKYKESWLPWKTDYDTGISRIEDWLRLVDQEKPNPFRPELLGRTTIVFVAPDDEYKLEYDERLGKHYVTNSTTEEAFATLRAQLAAYHYPPNEPGKAPKDMRPVKEFDDVVDALRGYAVMWDRDPDPLTDNEAVEAHMPEGYKMEELQAKSPYKKGLSDRQEIARHLMEQEVREKLGIKKQKPEWMEDAEIEVVDRELGDGW